MNSITRSWRSVDRNVIAVLLSVIPGAGHIYKHHYLSGFGIMLAGIPLIVFASILLSLATFGFSIILVPVGFMAAVAASAYEIPDWHGQHHKLHPEGPQAH